MLGKRFYNRIVAFVGQVMPPQSRTGSSRTSSSGDPGRESVRPARKVFHSRELHRLRSPASVVRSLEGEATLGCCLSRQVIRTNQRRLEILSVRASHRFAAQLPLGPAQPLCNYNVCSMSSTNSEEGSDEHSPSRGRPRLFEELTRHDEIRGGCSRVAREPVLPRFRLCPVQSFEASRLHKPHHSPRQRLNDRRQFRLPAQARFDFLQRHAAALSVAAWARRFIRSLRRRVAEAAEALPD
jgi:hypothetical protein